MYVFTSALFFIIFYSVFSVKNIDIGSSDETDRSDSAVTTSARAREFALTGAQNSTDSAEILKELDLL
jgi:hypothetical protein